MTDIDKLIERLRDCPLPTPHLEMTDTILNEAADTIAAQSARIEELEKQVEALKGLDEWQSIDTVPKDDTSFIVWDPNTDVGRLEPVVGLGWFDTRLERFWGATENNVVPTRPTHWKPNWRGLWRRWKAAHVSSGLSPMLLTTTMAICLYPRCLSRLSGVKLSISGTNAPAPFSQS